MARQLKLTRLSSSRAQAHSVTMTIHRLHVQSPYFKLIQSGEKTMEGRLRDKTVSQIVVGDEITFYTSDNEEKHTTVASVQNFGDFTEMLSAGRLEKLLPGVQTMEEGLKIYRGFPGYAEKEMGLGAVAFGLILVAGGP